MPFIVSLFKYVILGVCFLLLIGLAFIFFAVMDPTGPMQGLVSTPQALVGLLFVAVFMVLYLGVMAILISLHDRHKEIAEGVHRIAEAIEQSNAATYREG